MATGILPVMQLNRFLDSLEACPRVDRPEAAGSPSHGRPVGSLSRVGLNKITWIGRDSLID